MHTRTQKPAHTQARAHIHTHTRTHQGKGSAQGFQPAVAQPTCSLQGQSHGKHELWLSARRCSAYISTWRVHNNILCVHAHLAACPPGVGPSPPPLLPYAVLPRQVGDKNRSVGATMMNQDSSRSHSIFSITIEGMDKNAAANVGVTCPGTRLAAHAVRKAPPFAAMCLRSRTSASFGWPLTHSAACSANHLVIMLRVCVSNSSTCNSCCGWVGGWELCSALESSLASVPLMSDGRPGGRPARCFETRHCVQLHVRTGCRSYLICMEAACDLVGGCMDS